MEANRPQKSENSLKFKIIRFLDHYTCNVLIKSEFKVEVDLKSTEV